MKKGILTFAIIIAVIAANAQNERDAYRYSQDGTFGTARYMSLAGSMGAFGADFSLLSQSNPAAIGLYKRSEFTFTPTIHYKKTASDYNGTSSYANKYRFTMDNLGMVFALNIHNNTKWKMAQFATGYVHTSDYNGMSLVRGNNNNNGITSSFIDYLAPLVNGREYSSLGMGNTLADKIYYHWLIDTIPGYSDQYTSLVDDEMYQKQTQTTKGYKGEYIFSGGANYNDQLYIGLTLGIPFFSYTSNRIYSEGENTHYDSLVFSDYYKENGSGVNLKLGLIYQPLSFMRIGVGFHTPSFYNKVKSNYQQILSMYHVENVDSVNYEFTYADGYFNYTLITPYKIMANVGFMFKNWGFVNVDYEMTDYSTMQLQADVNDYDFEMENNNIKSYYKATHTIRVGAEFNVNPLSFRLGYAYMTNPYTQEINIDGSRHTISGGIGFKSKNFFMDFAYAYRIYNDQNKFYNAEKLSSFQQNMKHQTFTLTIGFKL